MKAGIHIDLTFELPHLKQKIQIHSDRLRVGIMGPSGFGKSSMARTLVGIERHGQGDFAINGKSLLNQASWERKIGYVPQDFLLLPHLSVIENILFPKGAEAQPELWKVLGIEALLERRPRLLSGGEKQRVAIARSLSHPSQLIIMDEPFSALDKSTRHRILQHLDGFLKERSLPLIIFSHEERDLTALDCDIHQLDS